MSSNNYNSMTSNNCSSMSSNIIIILPDIIESPLAVFAPNTPQYGPCTQ